MSYLLTAGAVHGTDRDRFTIHRFWWHPRFATSLKSNWKPAKTREILSYVIDFGVAIANFLAAASSLDLVPQESQIFTRISWDLSNLYVL